ncbi:MAG: hypothetical protein QT03_C0001G0018 [archaeon GW2011_AR10]|uniref:MBL fold metallo-hydrolase n=1 Tax=Candidatus Iainarchaeum sp. TaxID=3101447 RepID=A0A7J4IUG1_9ARCH|nr:MAG: hypothetical protein QT03_C0001G0018 [archaeon GW2011_AR10]HIH07989.1 MBL fold metallo-hydrolase [Candidatus Diapherotrites archaeon]
MKITFFGCAEEVGRAAYLVDAGNEKILLDYGVKLTPKATEYPLPIKTNLNAVIISHAHMDHSGNLPHLFVNSNPLSYMTPPTLDLAKMLWFDTLKIAGLEAIDANFSKQEIARTERYTFPVGYRKKMNITENVSMEFFDAGHVSGSAITKLDIHREKTLVYMGDFKKDETRLHEGADLNTKGCDILITESTYGDREHVPRKEEEKRFVADVQDTIDRGGHALVASFALGRSAEIVDILNEYNLNAEVYFDGMCRKAARIYLDYPQYIKNPSFLEKSLKKIHWINNISMRKKALKEPSVVVTTSGMLQGGPIYAFLPELYKDENSKLFLTGFQVHGTPGRILLEENKINLNGIVVEPKMKVERYDFSSHAGKSELLAAIKKLNPEKVICVHGDKQVMPKFKKSIEEEGFEAIVPRLGEEIIV